MHAGGTIIGYVSDVVVEERATLLIVEDRTAEKVRSTAVRCWNDKTKQAAGEVKVGSLVKVEFYPSSNKSSQGKWFSDINCSFIKVLSADNGEF